MRLPNLGQVFVRCLATLLPVWSERRFASLICDSGALTTVFPLTISVSIRHRPPSIRFQVCNVLCGCCSTFLSASLFYYSSSSTCTSSSACFPSLWQDILPSFPFPRPPPHPLWRPRHNILAHLLRIDAKIFSYVQYLWNRLLFQHFTPCILSDTIILKLHVDVRPCLTVSFLNLCFLVVPRCY